MACKTVFSFRALFGFAVCACALNAQPLSAATPQKAPLATQAGVFSHQGLDGQSYFALSIRAKSLKKQIAANYDHVILVDTSASQTGEHRKQAFAVVKSYLASLPKGNRVRLFAVDLTAQPLTRGFVLPNSEGLKVAWRSLNRRFPAGATDMLAAITAAADSIDGKRPSSILYVGDGMSTANLIQSSKMKQLLARLSKSRIAVHSYAVGPRQDLQLLGVLAQQTGGLVLFDNADKKQDRPETVGRKLASASVAPIFIPTTIKVNSNLTLLPNKPLPLREDRETIYLAKGKLNAGDVRITVSNAAGQTMTWTVPRKQVVTGHQYLHPLWNRAVQTREIPVSLAGNRLLYATRAEFKNRVDSLVRMGALAIATGQLERAEQIGLAVQKLDPENKQAKAILKAATKQASNNTIALLQAKAAQPPAKAKPTGPAEQKDELTEEAKRRNAILQLLQTSVAQAIQTARQVGPSDADGALGLLKEQLDTILATSRIDQSKRQILIKRLRTTMQEIKTAEEKNQIRIIESLQRAAQKEAQARLIEQIQLDEEDLEVLIDQIAALLEDARHGQDDANEQAEAVARVALDKHPGNGIATAALFVAEASGHIRKAYRMRALRADRFLEVLNQVELSHVPFPDEPPIRWPAAEVWQALTERRKKWASVDLHKNSPAEERILRELKKTTQVQFTDNTLKEALSLLAELHDIPIIAGRDVDLSTFEVKELTIASGITLRSALNLLLEEHDLQYVIVDEVMKIVTAEDADLIKTVRVYPVGDLVIAIPPPGALGGGGLQGGQQGGQFGGQQGGQFGGQQGGQFGGQGGQFGGGLGQFSLPPTKVNFQKQRFNRKPAARKQPVDDAELQGVLDNITGEKTSYNNAFSGQTFAQVIDEQAKPGFRLNNKSLKDLKKKQN